MSLQGQVTRFLEPNTDTDVIIPARFLKRTALDQFEPYAFYEKRYSGSTICEPTLEDKDYVFQKTALNPECSLNHPNCQDATFLLTWFNFGCGSSREHAVYALRDYKVIIGSAPEGKSAFADIFRDNCRQNIIWTPVISEGDSKKLNTYLDRKINAGAVTLSLDTEGDQLSSADGEFNCTYSIPDHHRSYLLAGVDAFQKAKIEIRTNLSQIETWEQSNVALLASSPNSSK